MIECVVAVQSMSLLYNGQLSKSMTKSRKHKKVGMKDRGFTLTRNSAVSHQGKE